MPEAESKVQAGENDIGLLINGQSRIGKTLITNAVSNSTFESKRSQEPVTIETDATELQFKDGRKLLVFNIPGLIEADKKNMQRNTEEVRKAFLRCPNSVVVYVFKDVSASVSGEAVAAFKALDESFVINDGSLLFVVNEWKGKKGDFEGEAATTAFIHKLTGKKAPVHFIRDYGESVSKAQMEEIRDGLIVQINALKPGKHNVEQKPLNFDPTDPAIVAQLEENKRVIAQLSNHQEDKEAEWVKFRDQVAQDRAAADKALATSQAQLEAAKQQQQQQGGGPGGVLGQLIQIGKDIGGLFGL